MATTTPTESPSTQTPSPPPVSTPAAQTLVETALAQATTEAVQLELERLREQLAVEMMTTTLRRADAEQVRRVADCLQQSLDSLLHALAQPVCIVDWEGVLIDWNPALASWTGIAREEAIGNSLFALITPGLWETLWPALTTCVQEAEEWSDPSSPPVSRLAGPFPWQEGYAVARITLLPLRRIPGVVEGVLLLLEPL